MSICPRCEKSVFGNCIVKDEEEKTGFNIVRSALEAPLRQIAENAGERADVIIDLIAKDKNPSVGYDFSKGEKVDMLEAGIVDPVKVTRSALQNAASAAGMLFTTEAVVADMPEEDKGGGMPAMPPPEPGDAPLVSFSTSAETNTLRADMVVPTKAVRPLIEAFGAMHGGPAGPAEPSEDF